MSAIETSAATLPRIVFKKPESSKLFSINLDQQGLVKCLVFRNSQNQLEGKLHFGAVLKSHESESAKTIRRIFTENIKIDLNPEQNTLAVHLSQAQLCSASINLQKRSVNLDSYRPILTYDIRWLSQTGHSHLKKIDSFYHSQNEYTPRPSCVDLHTHFGGAMDSQMILDVIQASETEVMYPLGLLKQMGADIYTGSSTLDEIDLKSEDARENINWKKFQYVLSMNPLSISTFSEMEDVYTFRTPLVKNLGLFPFFLTKLAAYYQEQGVEYVEFSISDIVKPDWMQIAIKYLPEIEKRTGVKIRFLAGLWRHSPTRFNEDILDKIAAYCEQENPYLVGVDFMGHETNSTRDFEQELKLCKKIKQTRPDFVIRVHAGESMHHPGNIRVAIENGATRIGHGLYGLSDETCALAKKNGTIVEANPSSNVCLHSVADPEKQIPICFMYRRGLQVSIGTDGHGLYGTDHRIESFLAHRLGVTPEQFDAMEKSNREYIEMMQTHFDRRMQNPHSTDIPPLPQSKFEPSEWQRIEERVQQQKEQVAGRIGELGIEYVDAHNLGEVFSDRTPVAILGASTVNWDPVEEKDKALIKEKLLEFFTHLDENKVVIITGGTDLGLEKYVHDVIAELSSQGRRFQLLGALSSDLEVDVSEVSNQLTHATITGRTWYSKGPKMLDWISKKNGVAFFIGGGNVIKDEIQVAHNLNIEFFLMRGIYGSSNTEASIYPERSFTKEEGLGPILLRSEKRGLLKLWKSDYQSVVDYFKSQNKEVVTFFGFSKAYADEEAFDDQVREILHRYEPQNTIINAGATEAGIGRVYPLAKELGFQTTGIVSTRAINEGACISKDVDMVFYVEDEHWGGIVPDTDQLSPTSLAMINCTSEAVALGGGRVTREELDGISKRDVPIIKITLNSKL